MMKGERLMLLAIACVCLAATGAVTIESNGTAAGEGENQETASLTASTFDQFKSRSSSANDSECNNNRRCDSQRIKKKFDIITSITMSWYDALEYCKQRHANLATIRSQKEHNDLVFLLKHSGLLQPPSTCIWIGGTVLSSQKGYFWMDDGEAVLKYQNWHKGEPNNSGGVEKCLTYTYSPSWYHNDLVIWNDKDCNLKFHFVCEYVSC